MFRHPRLAVRTSVSLLIVLGCAGGEPTGPEAPVVGSVSVSLATTIQVGDSVQASASVLSTTGSVISGRAVSWSSDNLTVATVNSSGIVRPVGPGTATISADVDGKTGSSKIIVLATVASVSVTLAKSAVHPGDSVQATSVVLSTTGAPISGRPTVWTSDNTSVATVNQTGAVKTVGLGTAKISAAVDGKSGSAFLRVVVLPVGSVQVSPDTASIVIGRALALAVVVKDSVGATVMNRTVAWTTSDSTKATVSSSGIVTGIQTGTVTVIGSVEGKIGMATISVLPVPSAAVASVSVSITRTAFRVGESFQVAAFPLDSVGGLLIGRAISWVSSNSDVASVSSGGLVVGVGPGVTTISAQVEGKSGNVNLLVSLVPVSTVTVEPATQAVSAGATLALKAVLKDSANRILSGRTISWSSSAPSIASVNADGIVLGKLVGSADITAASEGKQGKADISINTLATPVATVTLDPTTTNMSGGATKRISAILRDANGNVLGGRTITWTSSNPDRAVVSSLGLVTASAVDAPVVITASVEGKTATSSIGITTLTRLSTGSGFTCGLTADGTAYCWGANYTGQLGDGTLTSKSTPTKVSTELKFVAISSSGDHTCAIAVGSFLYCWGVNTSGKLGNGNTSNSSTPVAVIGGYQFVSVAAGSRNTCATTADKDVYCWGFIQYIYDDIYGGRYNNTSQLQPLKIGAGMIAVVAGLDGRFCSVDSAGLAYCWTVQYFFPMTNGGLGNGPAQGPIGGPISTTLHFSTLRMGLGHVCGLVDAGQAYCWGNNDYGQLGDGTTLAKSSPVAVSGGLIFESLAAGGTYRVDDDLQKSFQAGFACGITPAGKAYCWGANRFGELGSGSSAQFATSPQAVAGTAGFTGLRGGASHVCGLAIGGAAYCWGSNNLGQFGDGTTQASNMPTFVFGK